MTAQSIIYQEPSAVLMMFIPAFSFLLFGTNFIQVLILNFANITLLTFNLAVTSDTNTVESVYLIAGYAIFALGITGVCAVAGYYLTKIRHTEFKLFRRSENEYAKSRDIFSYLLPAFVRTRV